MSLKLLKPFTVDKPEPLIGAKTIQLVLMREVLDYTVLRTEETRELNTVATPLSLTDTKTIVRVAFLATKQKAAESRQLEQMLARGKMGLENKDFLERAPKEEVENRRQTMLETQKKIEWLNRNLEGLS